MTKLNKTELLIILEFVARTESQSPAQKQYVRFLEAEIENYIEEARPMTEFDEFIENKCKEKWQAYKLPQREEVLKTLGLPLSEEWYAWSALRPETRQVIVAEEMEYLTGKYQGDERCGDSNMESI